MKKQKDLIPKISAHVQFQTVSPATKLLQKRRKMYQVHEAFEVQKQQYKKQQQTFKSVEEDIRKRDLQIQIHLINFCQFLQENDSKRKKAVQRYNQEKQVYNKKVQEIQRLEQEIEAAIIKQEKFQKKQAQLKKYQQYLDKVSSTFIDQYPQKSDILSRYHTLKKSNKKLFSQKKQMQQQKQKLKKQSTAFQRQISQQLLTLGNDSKDYSKKLQEKINQKHELQSKLQRSRQKYSKKNLDLAKILMALDNLYGKCSQSPIRIRHDYQQFRSDKQSKKGKKRQQQKSKKQKDSNLNNPNSNSNNNNDLDKRQDQQNNLQLKCQLALMKLKSIFAYTMDYKIILDSYKKGIGGNNNNVGGSGGAVAVGTK